MTKWGAAVRRRMGKRMRDKILIVDDTRLNREFLKGILADEYEVVEAQNGKEALMILKKQYQEIVLVMLDLVMSDVDGFAVLEVMRRQKWLEVTPVIVMSGQNSGEAERKSLAMGASDFLRKPLDNYLVRRRVKNIADLYSYRRSLEKRVAKQTEALRKQYGILQLQAERIRESNARIIDILGSVVEYRNLGNGDHIRRVKDFTRILGNELAKDYPEYGLTPEQVEMIISASALHDIGKIAIPDSILLKPGLLTEDEEHYLRSHASRGAEIVQQIRGVWSREYGRICYDICRHHHERYDGRGYPDGLKGDETPIAAQIVAIADAYDQLCSERMSKRATTPEEAFHMVLSGESGVFSPKLLECFRKVKEELIAVALNKAETNG